MGKKLKLGMVCLCIPVLGVADQSIEPLPVLPNQAPPEEAILLKDVLKILQEQKLQASEDLQKTNQELIKNSEDLNKDRLRILEHGIK